MDELHTHTREERYQIYVLKRSGHKQYEIVESQPSAESCLASLVVVVIDPSKLNVWRKIDPRCLGRQMDGEIFNNICGGEIEVRDRG